MKNFLRWLGVGVLFLTAGAMAQPHPERERSEQMRQKGKMHHQKRMEKRMEKLTKELNLSKEQQKQISEILEEGRTKIDAERKTFREKIQEIRKAGDGQIEKVLTGEQLKKWQERRKKIGEKTKERREKRDNRRK